MALKQVELPGIGTLKLYKRRGTSSIRLSVTHQGDIRVSLPYWASYQSAINFVIKKADWIKSQQQMRPIFYNRQAIGKAHHLFFFEAESNAPKTKIRDNEIRIYVPSGMTIGSSQVQNTAYSASIKALRKEAENLLPARLQFIAMKHDLKYNQVKIRHLKSRWGSCDQSHNISLNLFLMQLPWHLIDYVLLHELIHTIVLRHGQPFWNEFLKHEPNAKSLRKEILDHKPVF